MQEANLQRNGKNMVQNIKSVPPIQLNIYQQINKDKFNKNFAEGILDICKDFLGRPVTKNSIEDIKHKIKLYFMDYFLYHGFSVPNWEIHCNFDDVYKVLIPFFVDEYANKIDISKAQYLIDYFEGEIPNNWWGIVE